MYHRHFANVLSGHEALLNFGNSDSLLHYAIDCLLYLNVDVFNDFDFLDPLLDDGNLHFFEHLTNNFTNDLLLNNLLYNLGNFNHLFDYPRHDYYFLYDFLDFDYLWHFDHLLNDLLDDDSHFLDAVSNDRHFYDLFLDNSDSFRDFDVDVDKLLDLDDDRLLDDEGLTHHYFLDVD